MGHGSNVNKLYTLNLYFFKILLTMQSKDIAFVRRVQRHFKNFIQEYSLLNEKKILVSASGGVDSMVLVDLLFSCGYSDKLNLIHFNHSTRIGQDSEQDFVNKKARQLGISCENIKLENLPKSNFEHAAREQRYKHYKNFSDRTICLGHHIDDSFEWSLMQKFRSSNYNSSLGIPLKNKNIVRPLMCLTKEQIRRYAKEASVEFIEDPTNNENKYERNFLRNEVIPSIKKKYPKYLKHYVHAHNDLAKKLKCHLIKSANYQVVYKNNSALIYTLNERLNPSGFEYLIVKAMKKINPNSRGSLSTQILKIKEAMKNYKSGPLVLTKGIYAYVSFNCIFLTKETYSLNTDLKKYKNLSLSEFKKLLCTELKNITKFPHWVKLEQNKQVKDFSRNKKLFPYNRDLSQELIDSKDHHISALKLLSQWSKPKNRYKKLHLSL